MKTKISLAVPKECYILCRLFRLSLPELLAFYMQQVNIEKLRSSRANEQEQQATWLFISLAARP